MSYGWARTELLGALTNGMFLLSLSLYIGLEAIPAYIEPEDTAVESNQQGIVFIIIAALGLVINTVGTIIFAITGQSHGHSHSHGGGGHGHSHGGGHGHGKHDDHDDEDEDGDDLHGHGHGHDHEDHDHDDHHGHGHSHGGKAKGHGHSHSHDKDHDHDEDHDHDHHGFEDDRSESLGLVCVKKEKGKKDKAID